MKRKHERCLNEDATVALFGSSEKRKGALTENPFCRDFDCGKNREGCWDENHATIQLEDVDDFFYALFPKEQCQIAFELDHSQCREILTKNSRVVKNFNLGPGGSVAISRDACVGNDSLDSCARPRKWKPGQTASYFCAETDEPPKHNPKIFKHGTRDIENTQ